MNELGSWMGLCADPDGALSGTYTSAVGTTRTSQPLRGQHGPQEADGSAVVAFIVAWPATGSLATWIGRYDAAHDRIVATWVLESGSSDATAWRATHLGHDVFRHASPDMTPDPLAPTT